MAPSQKAKAEKINEDHSSEDRAQDSLTEENVDAGEASPVGESATTSKGSTSKQRKESKAARALNALRGKKEIPQEVVDRVLDKVKDEAGDAAPPDMDANSVRLALEHLKILDVLQGKAGLGGKNKKDLGEHKFWRTQPVPQLGEEGSQPDGTIEPAKSYEEIRKEPYPLPKEFEWATFDMTDTKQIKEVYDLLSTNYVEDDAALFRFQYTPEFLQWALQPPGYHKEWHIGVRVASNKKLVAFIAGVPITLRVRGTVISASEINYLCVHKKLRSKRLAPVLIKEVTRQCHLKGIFHAIYTAGVVLPTPVATCRYYHRLLNIPKLVDVKFAPVPRNQTLARMIRLNKVPSELRTKLREMEEKDIHQVFDLFTRYMQRFDLVPVMTIDEVRHQFLSGLGKCPVEAGRRADQVIWSYVVESSDSQNITDFLSFYTLPSAIANNPKHDVLNAAYLYYYASDVAFEAGADQDGRLKKRLQDLVSDAIIFADRAKFDVFNALTLMDNSSLLADLKFGAGDGVLNFYLYNYRTSPLAGVQSLNGVPAGRGVGVVMV